MVSFWQSQEVTSGAVQVPPLAAGHKGLFFERLDAGALTWAGDGYVETHPYAPLATLGGLGQAEVSQPYLIGHARNRTLHTVLGQWNQRDPNATGMVNTQRPSFHGLARMTAVSGIDLLQHARDGANVFAYCRLSPHRFNDQLGLFVSLADLAGGTGRAVDLYIDHSREVMVTGRSMRGIVRDLGFSHAMSQMLDMQWAADWGSSDDDYSGGMHAAVSGVTDGAGDPTRTVASLRLLRGPGQVLHHIFTNTHKKFSRDFQEVITKAGVDDKTALLWISRTVIPMSANDHRGRHKEAYHKRVLYELRENLTGVTDRELARKLFDELADELAVQL